MACVSHNVKGLKSLVCLLTVKLKKRENKLTVAYAWYLTDVKYFVRSRCELTMAYAWYLTTLNTSFVCFANSPWLTLGI